MAENKNYSIESVLSNIDRCVLFSNGIFLKNSVTDSRQKKESLNQFCRRYPGVFEIISKLGTSILSTTPIYVSLRKLNVIVPSKLDKISLLRATIWSAFILQNDMDISLKNEEFPYLNSIAILDDFQSNYEEFNGVVITIPSRSKEIKASYLIPRILISELSQKVIANLMNDSLIYENNKTIFKNFESNLLKDGIWPEYENECHIDERIYPFIGSKISGIAKWKYDQYIINNNGEIPENYKFGVYPK